MSWNETVKSRNVRKLDAQQCDLSRRQDRDNIDDYQE